MPWTLLHLLHVLSRLGTSPFLSARRPRAPDQLALSAPTSGRSTPQPIPHTPSGGGESATTHAAAARSCSCCSPLRSPTMVQLRARKMLVPPQAAVPVPPGGAVLPEALKEKPLTPDAKPPRLQASWLRTPR